MQQLYTEAGRSLSGVPWARYPRPQMVRRDWLCLNGDWDFAWGDVRTRIRVPFCPESLLSGVSAAPPPCGTEMHYARRFTLPPAWQGRHLLLHFGAVSRSAEVTVNGALAGRSENGYLPFTLDITALVRPGENELRVRCVNDLDPRYPWGKQTLRRGGMWYTPCSGIWQTVWLEPVPEGYIRALSVETGPDWFSVAAEGAPRGTVCFEGARFPLGSPIPVADGVLWTPETPRLYRFTVECGDDAVESYFALRTLSVGRVGGVPRLLLNGKPYFFHGLLDQGYWSDGLYTPAAPECYEQYFDKTCEPNTMYVHVDTDSTAYEAGALAFIVLFNLSNINITERVREIATIKVFGFYPGETGSYVFRENFVLTLKGIVVGLPLGYLLHSFVMSQIQVDMVAFASKIMNISYLYSVLIVLAFLVIVDLVMRRKIDKIDMAESLKSIE